jgi:hypothetical protein
MTRDGKLAESIAEQIASNRSAAGHEGHFAEHRARLTREIGLRAPEGGRGRLCLLGVGNANDVDLGALAGGFAEIHLVDIDHDAVAGAVARVTEAHRHKLFVHAPLDASGIFDRLEEWSRNPAAPDAIAREVPVAVGRVVAALPGPFDVVVSCCLITQLQLVLLQVVGDRNPRFQELRLALGRIHMLTLAALLGPGGVALLVTDLTGSDTFPFDELVAPVADLGALMRDLLAADNIIYAAHPGRLSAEIRRDAALAARFAVRLPVGPWLWHNGPDLTFLVYALEITARPEVGAAEPAS